MHDLVVAGVDGDLAVDELGHAVVGSDFTLDGYVVAELDLGDGVGVIDIGYAVCRPYKEACLGNCDDKAGDFVLLCLSLFVGVDNGIDHFVLLLG